MSCSFEIIPKDEDYVIDLQKRMNKIYENIILNIKEASDQMKEQYDVKAEKGEYRPRDLFWLIPIQCTTNQ